MLGNWYKLEGKVAIRHLKPTQMSIMSIGRAPHMLDQLFGFYIDEIIISCVTSNITRVRSTYIDATEMLLAITQPTTKQIVDESEIAMLELALL